MSCIVDGSTLWVTRKALGHQVYPTADNMPCSKLRGFAGGNRGRVRFKSVANSSVVCDMTHKLHFLLWWMP